MAHRLVVLTLFDLQQFSFSGEQSVGQIRGQTGTLSYQRWQWDGLREGLQSSGKSPVWFQRALLEFGKCSDENQNSLLHTLHRGRFGVGKVGQREQN